MRTREGRKSTGQDFDDNPFNTYITAMSHSQSTLPILTVNRSFIQNFLDAETPCFALGFVEERNQNWGLLALRPDEAIPTEITNKGLNFGHSLLGNNTFEVIHFAFEFYGYRTYNVLLNPSNPIVQAVVATMIDSGAYFFFALNAKSGVTTFRAEIGQDTLLALRAYRSRLQQSTTTEAQYNQAVASFRVNPQPEGRLLQGVCRENIDYLNLTTDRLELTPR